ncbi:hypothetical protein [Blastopirellula marina]|uniref:Biofilm PGA synthesis protein PgaB n=1 Tax=Blastopirellula marina TaxID=124 RepID=A0A2S8GE89_9BACT|nr:hypothetical protein [Blastopirellula marina]PQO42766.1 hypothetical protein C5Y98_01020 [Blastopirellula marina]PTL46532.1 hypothetical protein C5Y97_01020 [Blastopirellula marina]
MIKHPAVCSLVASCVALLVCVSPSFGETPDTSQEKTSQPIRVGVLSSAAEPGKNTSQGLYIKILRNAGMEAKAVSAEAVRAGALNDLDIFIIGGGSGTAFNKALGAEGGELVEKFVEQGGGVLASCAGGYSFARGHSEALSYVEIANAVIIDNENRRWARGKGNVEIETGYDKAPTVTMFYANGPLWKITDEPGFGVTKALGSFRTDIKKKGDEGGVMPGTPAILGGTYGKGRFVLFSAHPEFHWKLGNPPLVADAARWVVQGELKPGEDVNWASVFPSSGQPKEEK